MRPRLIGGLSLAIFAAGAATFALTAAGAAAPSTTLPTNLEAWYETLGCSNAALGCGLVTPPEDPYPANTLHVGNAAGMPYEETFITLDTSAVTGRIASGVLTLPVATDSQAASANTSAAKVIACLATSVFTSAEFVTSSPPTTNCAVTSTATYDATTQSFSLDLAPFIASGGGSLTNVGIGLLPDPTDTTGTWQLTFNGRNRMVAGQSPITAAVTLAAPASVPTGTAIAPTTTVKPVPVPSVRRGRSSAKPAPARTTPRASTAPVVAAISAPAPAVVPVGSLPSAAPVAASVAGAQLAPVIAQKQLADGVPAIPQSPQRVLPVALSASTAGQYGLVWAVPLGLIAIATIAYRAATTEHVIESTEEQA